MIPECANLQLVSDKWSNMIVLASSIDDLVRSIQHSLKLLYSGQRSASQKGVATIYAYLGENKTVHESLGCLLWQCTLTAQNHPIRWQIWTCIKVILEHFSLVLTVSEIFTFQNTCPWKCRSRLWRTRYSGPIWRRIRYFISDGNSDVCIFQCLLLKKATSKFLITCITRHVWPWKFRPRSQSTPFAMVPFNC